MDADKLREAKLTVAGDIEKAVYFLAEVHPVEQRLEAARDLVALREAQRVLRDLGPGTRPEPERELSVEPDDLSL